MKIYNPVIKFFVKTRIAAVILGILILIAGVFIYPRLGSEFTPTLKEGTLVVRLALAPSISIEESKKTALLVEKRIMQVEEVTGTVSRIGRGEVGAHTDPINSIEMYILLKGEDDWRPGMTQEKLEDDGTIIGDMFFKIIDLLISSFPKCFINIIHEIHFREIFCQDIFRMHLGDQNILIVCSVKYGEFSSFGQSNVVSPKIIVLFLFS